MQAQFTTPTVTADPLDTALVNLARQGWRLQLRTPTTMQLVKPKRFNPTEGALLAFACVGLVLLGGVGGVLIAALLAVGDAIWYAARKDETMLVALDADGHVQQVGAGSAAVGGVWIAPTRLCTACGHRADRHAALRDACNCGHCRRFAVAA